MFYNFATWKVIIAIIAYFVIGAIWYSPAIFGKIWQNAVGKKGKMSMRGPSMLIGLLTTAVIVLVFTYIAHMTGIATVARGAYLGVKVWLGFVATIGLMSKTYQGTSLRLYLIDSGYHLAGLVVTGIILAS